MLQLNQVAGLVVPLAIAKAQELVVAVRDWDMEVRFCQAGCQNMLSLEGHHYRPPGLHPELPLLQKLVQPF